MPETWENWLDPVNSWIYYARQTREMYQVPYCLTQWISKHPGKPVLSKCSFIWNKGPVNIWNDHKAQR